MKSIEEIVNADQNIDQDINEGEIYDQVISSLMEAKENNVPVDEGIFGAIAGAATGAIFGPKVMTAICSALGVDVKGAFGSLLTSRLILTAVGGKLGMRL